MNMSVFYTLSSVDQTTDNFGFFKIKTLNFRLVSKKKRSQSAFGTPIAIADHRNGKSSLQNLHESVRWERLRHIESQTIGGSNESLYTYHLQVHGL